MLVFNVTFRCKPGTREEFLARVRAEGLDTACRAEEGNLQYDYYLSVDRGEDLLLIEKWKDADAVRAHAGQKHMARFEELKSEYVTDLILEAYVKDR